MRAKHIAVLFVAIASVLFLTSGTTLAGEQEAGVKAGDNAVDLAKIRGEIYDYFEKIRDKGGPYGCYRRGPGRRSGLYASLDVALMRAIMGEDLMKTLNAQQRREWINLINSYQDRKDGHYEDTLGHSKLHGNGMVIGALGVLGGQMRYPVKLYEPFDTVEEIGDWLDKEVDWSHLWGGSHLFWGGLHCFSFSKACTPEWRDAVIEWLSKNVDPQTGWWRKGVKHASPYEPLGGMVHIIPIYEHHGYRFPYPKKTIDSILELQAEKGHWLAVSGQRNYMTYMELDALYALRFMQQQAPGYRTEDIKAAVRKYSDLVRDYWPVRKKGLFGAHPHHMLAAVGIFGLLQQHMPEVWQDEKQWTDIFSDRQLYRTAEVEKLPSAKK
jgi:hypothetical protein